MDLPYKKGNRQFIHKHTQVHIRFVPLSSVILTHLWITDALSIYHVFMFHYSNITRNLRHKDLNVGDRMTKLNVLVTYFGQMRGH